MADRRRLGDLVQQAADAGHVDSGVIEWQGQGRGVQKAAAQAAQLEVTTDERQLFRGRTAHDHVSAMAGTRQ